MTTVQQMSSVVIGFDGAPREAAVPAGALRDLVRFQPTTKRTFGQTDTLRLFVLGFWDPSDESAEVTVSGDGSRRSGPAGPPGRRLRDQ